MTKDNVEAEGADIYFHCDVDDDTVLEFNMKLNALTKTLRKVYIDYGIAGIPTIRVWLKSNGGDVYSGFSAADAIREARKTCDVETIADGQCCSSATFMLLAGSTRCMTPNAWLLIHQIQHEEVSGNFQEIKQEFKNLRVLMDRVERYYKNKCKIPEDVLNNLLTKEIQLSAQECFTYKIIDKIL